MDVMEGVRGLGWDRRTDSQRHKGGEQRVSVGVDRWTDRQTNGWMLWEGVEAWIGADRQTDRHKRRGQRVWVGEDGWTDRWTDGWT